jgi:hypothetical protein
MDCRKSDFDWKEKHMNETNLSEARLRSWQPRRPSARLKERIFPVPVSRPMIVTWSLRLAPAAASFLVALSVLRHDGGFSGGGFQGEPMLLLSQSNRIAFVPVNCRQEHNELYGVTFDWTNRSNSTSSITSFSPDTAN